MYVYRYIYMCVCVCVIYMYIYMCVCVCVCVCIYLYTYIHIYIVIVIVITTYHAVYWSYRAWRADRWFLPRSIPWDPGLPEVAHSMTEDPEDGDTGQPGFGGSGNCKALALATATDAGPFIRRG